MDFCIKSFNELTLSELYEIMKGRQDIFTLEKGMRCADLDGRDYIALHCVLKENGKLIAYLRILEEADSLRLGRVITLTHGRGHGKILMENVLRKLQALYPKSKITVHSQYDAVGFYEKCGFTVTSPEFVEAGVRHFEMELKSR